ncbi:hypothetical protein Ancab_033919 [Ancistrocladus abbreviatus]
MLQLPNFILCIFICLFFLTNGSKSIVAASTDSNASFSIGAIVNVGSRIGREQKTAMEIAVQNFNANSRNQNLSIHFRNSSGDPLQAAFAAEELIEKNQVKVVIGMEKWEEAVLVAEAGSKAEVPVLSLSAAAITPPFTPLQWPFLVQMATDGSMQAKCLAQIVHLYQWRRVIIAYEDQPYGGDSGILSLLPKILQMVGSDIEYRLVLPPLASLSNPKEAIREQLGELITQKYHSRVFIVLDSSLTLAHHLFEEAQKMGLAGRDSVWLITESIADLFSSSNNSNSVIEGALGIKRYYSKSRKSYQDFEAQFWLKFSDEYPEDDNPYPGFHSLLAYDAITATAKAIQRSTSTSGTSKMLLESILSGNFAGLSGQVYFEESKIARQQDYRIVNVVDGELRELDFWIPGIGFSKSMDGQNNGATEDQGLSSEVTWPGKLNGMIPKGWEMPTKENPLKIGVPGRHNFQNLVKVPPGEHPPKDNYTGLCIELFRKVLNVLENDLNYTLHYDFFPYNGTYEDLIDHVYNKSLDAIVGDVTILANRTDYIEFTQPFAESGLSLVLPDKSSPSRGWIFLRPFRVDLWLLTFAMLMYTALIVWFLEHKDNPEFRGSWKEQISAALYFIFNSLFFSHRENLGSNLSRVVVVVWLFIVLVLTQSYTADLASMLTLDRLNQNATSVETLLIRNAKVGSFNTSFVMGFLEEVLQFKQENVISIEEKFEEMDNAFKNGRISAAFLEVPYAKLFHYQNCNTYTIAGPLYRFGGLGFVFQKGSPIAIDVSRAILTLTENGTLKDLEGNWTFANSKCATDDTSDYGEEKGSLNFKSFWGLFLLSFSTSTLCLFVSILIPKLMNYHKDRGKEPQNDINTGNNGNRISSISGYAANGDQGRTPTGDPVIMQTPDVEDWGSSGWVCISFSDTPLDHTDQESTVNESN